MILFHQTGERNSHQRPPREGGKVCYRLFFANRKNCKSAYGLSRASWSIAPYCLFLFWESTWAQLLLVYCDSYSSFFVSRSFLDWKRLWWLLLNYQLSTHPLMNSIKDNNRLTENSGSVIIVLNICINICRIRCPIGVYLDVWVEIDELIAFSTKSVYQAPL